LGTTLTQLHGIGALTAGKIVGRVGTITRFRSAAAFASYTGTAPIEASSGDVLRHRLSRAGNRQLNHCPHIMAITQLSHNTRGRAYYQSKHAAGKSHREALRCPKRRLSDAVYRRLVRDVHPDTATGPEDARGDYEIQRGRLTPTTDFSDKSLPGSADTDPTTPRQDQLCRRGAVIRQSPGSGRSSGCASVLVKVLIWLVWWRVGGRDAVRWSGYG